MLQLTTKKDMLRFSDKYTTYQKKVKITKHDVPEIKFEKLWRDFAGLEIPIFHKKLHDLYSPTGWYYGWDAASGILWRHDPIRSITRVI